MKDRISGGGEAGALIRSLDWARTPLGPIDQWPSALVALTRMILHARQPMVVWWGAELTQVYNDAMLRSVRDKNPSGMGRPAREAWREAWKVVGPELQAVVDVGASIWQEDMFVPLDRNGRIEDAWWTYNYSPVFDDDDTRAGIIITCTETTTGVLARRGLERARGELDEVLRQARTPIAIVLGADYRFWFANPAYVRLVDRDVLGRPLMEAFSEAEAGYYRPLLDRAFLGGEAFVVREAELNLVNASGHVERRYLDASYQPYYDENGERIGVLVDMTDMTLSVRARQRAEEEGRQRDEFLAMLSHELRNPLASIASAVELMEMTGEQHARERMVIGRQVEHLNRLVRDLLDVARISRGKLDLQRKPVSLETVMHTAIEQAMPLVLARKNELVQQFDSTPLVVDGDAVRLTQVFSNLLTNAAKYTPTGTRITISTARDGDDAVTTVTDAGPGLDASLLPRVFDLFVQGERGPDRSEGGLGLGLALVKRLVEMHGGSVSASNAAEGGAQFVVRLPLSQAETSRETEPVPAMSGRARILVVDDNSDAADLLGDLLRLRGHDVSVRLDGPSALATIADLDPEIIVCDIGLPVMDGYEVARRVRAMPGGLRRRLIAVTGYGAQRDRDATREAGFDEHLTKPVGVAALLGAIGRTSFARH